MMDICWLFLALG